MSNRGYLRFPAIRGDQLVFVTDDDLWSVSAEGGVARRLTAGLGDIMRPQLSPDGRWIAYTAHDEGHPEVFVMPAEGGPPQRRTWLGLPILATVGFTADNRVLVSAGPGCAWAHAQARIHTLAPDGGQPEPIDIGPAREIAFGPGNACVIGRSTTDPGRWKRYKGGTRGDLWVDADGGGTFERLITLEGNVAHPMWIADRIWFVSDDEGIGNLYSCQPDGSDLRRHTDHTDYYVRFANTDGNRIVYQCGAQIWLFDPATGQTRQVPIEARSPRNQLARRFTDADENLESIAPHPKGHSVCVVTRGKPFAMPLWEQAVRQVGERQGVRYRHAQWLPDGDTLVMLTDAGGEEAIEIHPTDPVVGPRRLDGVDIGRATEMVVSPTGKQVALTNHRGELIVVDLADGNRRVLDHSRHHRIQGVAWSPDGKWLAWAPQHRPYTSMIRLGTPDGETAVDITEGDFGDMRPAFDPEGKYLYFLSYRVFDPVYDSMYFDLGFPRGSRPYLVTLKADTPSPFRPEPRAPGANGKAGDKPDGDSDKKDDTDTLPDVTIDLDGIQQRILPLPVSEGRYQHIAGIKGKVLFTSEPIPGGPRTNWRSGEVPARSKLECFSFEDQETTTIASKVSAAFSISHDGSTLVYRAGKRVRAIKAGEKAPDGGKPGRKSGWLDLGRIRFAVEPRAEWAQMQREAWRLMRDQFWVEDMSGVDWDAVGHRYHPDVLDPGTRAEFSDLMWEMQGELGTSHAYEMGGDRREPPALHIGQLGADIAFDPVTGRYRIERIVPGDCWNDDVRSPLAEPGLGVTEGDTILAVSGQPVSADLPPGALLVHQAGQAVSLTIGNADGAEPREVVVTTLASEQPLRYREWVDANRRHVHEATDGRVGYVHIPNMGPDGFAEFHRYFRAEFGREGLVVDVRYNGGGHVSQLLLEKLARKPIGYDQSRWHPPTPYPDMAWNGPMVALTNEYAGSDGDIFSHCWKLMKLGPLVGRRTWGGVIGIHPRHRLVDGTVTTQPEFSFWFEDVGWQVENYGTDPDHDVDIAPQDHAAGRDPQMAKGLELVMGAIEANPPRLPDFGPRPQLAPPTELPPRQQ